MREFVKADFNFKGSRKSYNSNLLFQGFALLLVVICLLAFGCSGDEQSTGPSDTTRPTVTGTTPSADATGFTVAGNIVVTFSEPIDSSSVTSTSFRVNEGSPVTLVASPSGFITGTISVVGNVVTFNPDEDLKVGTNYTVILDSSIKDKAGNSLSESFSIEFATFMDLESPFVVNVSPNPGSSDIDPGSNIVVTFSEPIDQSTVDSITFSVTSNGTSISGTYAFSSNSVTVTFNPYNDFQDYADCNIQLTSGIQDLVGNPLSIGVFESSFTISDLNSPTVLNITPDSGSTEVDPTSIIVVEFSEPIDTATITASTFKVSSGGINISGVFTFSSSTDTVMFTPDSELQDNTTCNIQLTSGIKDIAGNPLSVVFEASFVTSDITAPFVVSTIPGDGATGQSLSTPVQIFFSENVDAGSIDVSKFGFYSVTSVGPGNIDTSYIPLSLVSTTGHIITLSVDETLEYESAYYISVFDGAVSDSSGNSFSQSHVSTFTTELAPDLTPPFIIEVTPIPDINEVPVDAFFEIEFSEAIGNDEASLQSIVRITGTYYSYEQYGNSIDTIFNHDTVTGYVKLESADQAVFYPDEYLKPGASYNLTISSYGLFDLAGNINTSTSSQIDRFNTEINLPVADAGGPYMDVNKGASIQISGSSTDPNGGGLTYYWEQTWGPSIIGGITNDPQQTIQLADSVSTVVLAFWTIDSYGYQGYDFLYIRVWNDKDADNQFVSPGQSIQSAIDAAAEATNPGDVYVAYGEYYEIIHLKSGVNVYGDYNYIPGNPKRQWIRDETNDPVGNPVNSTYLLNDGIADDVIFNEYQSSWTVCVYKQNNIVFDRINIISVDRPESLGEWSDNLFVPDCYGIIIEGSSNITISDNYITTGNARPGAKGANGLAGYEGTDGSPGTPGQGGAGGDFGGVIGDEGGRGGDPVAGGSGLAGSENGSYDGNGGYGGVWGSWSPMDGGDGESLLYGSGAPGIGGRGTSVGEFGFFMPANGQEGENKSKWGNGGGGGGAGAGINGYWGGAGGGGGSGGGPGIRPGKGGWGGGASIGIIAHLGTHDILVIRNTFVTGNGGDGGDGGDYGSGGDGGSGGAGGTPTFSAYGQNGAKGGDGSRGSSDGPGGSGSGGPSLGILAGSTCTGIIYLENAFSPSGLPGVRGEPGSPHGGGSFNPEYGENGISQLFYQVP